MLWFYHLWSKQNHRWTLADWKESQTGGKKKNALCFNVCPLGFGHKGVEKLTKERHNNAASGLRLKPWLSHENLTAQNNANSQQYWGTSLEPAKIWLCVQYRGERINTESLNTIKLLLSVLHFLQQVLLYERFTNASHYFHITDCIKCPQTTELQSPNST